MPKDVQDLSKAIIEEVSLQSGSHRLVGRLFKPTGTPSVAVLLNGATGVPQSYYQPFAEWLAVEKGYACLTYDYRDFAASQTVPMRDSDADMVTWGVDDQMAARSFLKEQYPDQPLWIVGHSLGAMLLNFQKHTGNIDRIITVASGMAYWPVHPMPYRLLALTFWYGHAPLLTRLFGYLPGKRMGLGADLPPGVYWQWRRWCTSPDFYSADIGDALSETDPVEAPTKVVAIADDQMMPPAAVWRLMAAYPDAPKKQLTIWPKKYGIDKIGHIGIFDRKSAAAWPDIMA
ncbi:MAG: alpha/beta fold hydrolase [Pseudomonadota bacterium]